MLLLISLNTSYVRMQFMSMCFGFLAVWVYCTDYKKQPGYIVNRLRFSLAQLEANISLDKSLFKFHFTTISCSKFVVQHVLINLHSFLLPNPREIHFHFIIFSWKSIENSRKVT